MDEQIDELLETVSGATNGELLLGEWYRCFSGRYTAAQQSARDEIKNTLRNKECLRDPQMNFIRKLHMNDQPKGYGMERGHEVAYCFLDSMRQLPYWQDLAKASEDDLTEELLDIVSGIDENLLFEWFKCFDACPGEQRTTAELDGTSTLQRKSHKIRLLRARKNGHETPHSSRDEQRLKAKEEIKYTLRTGMSTGNRPTETDFVKKLLLKYKSGGYKIKEGAQLASNFLKGMKQLPCWKIFAASLEDYFTENLLDAVSKINETLLLDWFMCFEESTQRLGAKCEIKNTMESQCDPEKNFIMRLVSGKPNGYTNRDGECKRRIRLAELFLLVMRKNSYWDECVAATVNSSLSNDIEGASVIYRATKNPMNFEEIKQRYREISLHEAARLEDACLVDNLIKGAAWTSDDQGCTPLHFAAMAIHPHTQIAKDIVQAMTKSGSLNMINKRSNKESGRNTALHIAAGNVNVTQDFIAALKDADPVIFNDEHYSPFHVAAKSKNQDVIMYMLNTFAPTNNRWDVDDVDVALSQDKKREDTLINICARNGNAKAVALLIQHGADISQGVLHEIVLESVNSPEKTGKLLEVYQSIVDNAVTWRCLEENRVSPLKGSTVYSETLKKTMVWLLTNPLPEYQNRDVLEYAISRAASTMFQHIINTVGVFRHVQFLSDETTTTTREVTFDVTNYTEETILEPQSDDDGRNDDELLHRSPSVKGGSIRRPERNFNKRHRPRVPYLQYLLSRFNRWKNGNILSTQPLKQLTKPYFALIQRFYLLVGLLQLLFMVLFSLYYTPDTCSLSLMFNVNITHCSNSGINDVLLEALGNNTTSSIVSQQRSSPTLFWLIWPIILIAVSIVGSYYSADYTSQMYTVKAMGKGNYAFQYTRRVYKAANRFLLQSIVLKIFCCMVFAWFYMYHNSENHESYVEVTAMVLLFGWLTNLEFFGAINQNFSISVLVVKEIIANDIPSFMLIFAFTLVGFSFAMHSLRMSTCELNYIYFQDTFYGVLSSAFGIGEFFERAFSDRSCVGAGMQHLFEVVYFGYIGITLIILLNVLIAMMNNRYELAKQKAENIWRFRILSQMRTLESHKIFGKVLRKCNIPNLWRPGTEGGFWCYFGCWFHDKYNGKVERVRDAFYMRYLSRTTDPK